MISFRVQALPREVFAGPLALDVRALARLGGRWCVADAEPGYPCRVSLVDAEVGEPVLLVPFAHHDVASPYRASGPVFVRRSARTRRLRTNEIPRLLRHRTLSLRAYDDEAFMVGAETVEGTALEGAIEAALSDAGVAYLHVHYAAPGCYACRVVRA